MSQHLPPHPKEQGKGLSSTIGSCLRAVENPWWVFLTDLPSREEREIFGWRGMLLALREPVLVDYNQEDTLLERRIFLGKPITISLLGIEKGGRSFRSSFL